MQSFLLLGVANTSKYIYPLFNWFKFRSIVFWNFSNRNTFDHNITIMSIGMTLYTFYYFIRICVLNIFLLQYCNTLDNVSQIFNTVQKTHVLLVSVNTPKAVFTYTVYACVVKGLPWLANRSTKQGKYFKNAKQKCYRMHKQ